MPKYTILERGPGYELHATGCKDLGNWKGRGAVPEYAIGEAPTVWAFLDAYFDEDMRAQGLTPDHCHVMPCCLPAMADAPTRRGESSKTEIEGWRGEKLRNGATIMFAAYHPSMEVVVLADTGRDFVTWGVDARGNSYAGHYHGHDVAGLRKALDDFEERSGIRDAEVSAKVQAFADKVLAAYHRGQS